MTGRAVAARSKVLRLAVAALTVALASGLAAPARAAEGLARTASPSSCPATPFSAGFDSALRSRWPGARFSISVHDRRDGCAYDYRPDLRITTASVLKAEILAGVLLRAQAEGRGVTSWEHQRIGPMISRSADPEANALWSYLGGVPGMQRVDAAFGLTATAQHSRWGLTTSSARDRTRLMRLLVSDSGPLAANYRAIARRYLLDVVPSQRWGITAGLPGGTPVPMKNGFFDSSCCRWRLNSSGVVEVAGGGYVATIMSDGWRTSASGIAAVDWIGRVISARLAGPVPPFRSPADLVDQNLADLAGRTASFNESMRWSAEVGHSSARGAAFAARLHDAPAFAGHVAPLLRLYDSVHRRWPSHDMFAYRLWQLRRGATTQRAIAEEMARAPEVTGGGTLTNAEFVDRMVRRVMAWPADAASVNYWAGRLDRGEVSRGEVLRAYAESPESRWFRWYPTTVAGLYLALLNRAPEPAAVDYWGAQFGSGSGLAGLIGSLYRSPEYRARLR